MSTFVNLHVHTAYSLLDSMIRIPTLIERVVALKQTACAITDHGTLGGAVKFTDACLKAGIKPLLGQEFYISPDSRHRRGYPAGSHTASHLIIFAKNAIGWKNLIMLSTLAYTEGYYRKPRIDKELLYTHRDGLIVTSACIGGDVAIYLKGGVDPESAAKVPFSHVRALGNADWYMDVFGEDFYFEMQSYNRDYQEKINGFYRKHFPKSQLIASADCHYVFANQADTHDTLIACQSVRPKNDPHRWRFVSDQFYVKSEEEMLERFFINEVENTRVLAEKIDFILPLRKQFSMPKLSKEVTGENQNETFVLKCLKGIRRRKNFDYTWTYSDDEIVINASQEREETRIYADRLQREINIFIRASYVEYTLLLWDLVTFCEREGIFMGPGRGSGAGSLVLFALGIIQIDPIKHGCLFERFINPGRMANFSPPDVDLDFPQSLRGNVLEYLRETYGHDNVCQIGTYAGLGPAALIRKLKVPLGLSEQDVSTLTAAIPLGEGSVQGRGAAGDIGLSMTLGEVYLQSVSFKNKIDSLGYTGKMIMEYGTGLAFLGSHVSTHASGLVIANQAVNSLVPLMTVKSNTSIRDMMSQFDMSDVEAVGLIKYDILGLKTLDELNYCQEQIRIYQDASFSFVNIDMTDPNPLRILHEGRTVGIFQADGGGFGGLLPQAKPENIDELAILTSLCRPGPVQAGITQTYIRRKQGREEVIYEIPQLEPILKTSLGCIVFQEQIMRIAAECAGYTLAEADDLRKIMGKKQRDKMPDQREKFLTGLARICGKNDQSGELLWAQIESMSEYVFNLSHAVAYSYLTYWTAWSKVYFPSYFFAAAMTSQSLGDGDQFPSLLLDLRKSNVVLQRPDINESELHYHAVSSASIRIGLLGIHGVGATAVESILAARRDGPFVSRDDFRSRIAKKKVNSAAVLSLEQAGGFDLLDDRIRRVTVESLLEEFHLFGFFFSGHPCQRLRALWLSQDPNLSTIADMQTSTRVVNVMKRTFHGMTRVQEHVPFLIRGIVTKYDTKKSKSKAGAILHFLDLEDETGVVHVFLNQKSYDRLGITTISKAMGLEIYGSRPTQSNRAGDFVPLTVRKFSFTQ